MDEFEKVINRLNNEITHNEYWDEEYADCVPVSLLKDALELLKAQEPRVMTLEEIAKSEIGFLEFTTEEDITQALLIDVYADNTVGVITPDEDGEYWLPTNEYGKTWRCWTSRPTDEQREKVKWE